MADAISIQELIDARTDAKTLEEAVNGDAVTTVLSRLGESYPTLANALSQIDGKLDSADAQIKQAITDLFQNGGLPATPFATKALMTASALVDGDYAMVTDGGADNGLYVKTAGTWVKSAYDPLTQAKDYTDTAKQAAIDTAATDATTKADNAKTQAVADSKTYTDAEIVKVVNKSSGTFDTLALLTASTLVNNAYALVANDTDLTKNGHYKKVAGVWTKVKYDPIAQAKTYTDASAAVLNNEINEIKKESKNNLKGIAGKNLFNKDNVIVGKSLDASGVERTDAQNSLSEYIQIEAGSDYFVTNSGSTWVFDNNKVFLHALSANAQQLVAALPDGGYIRTATLHSKIPLVQVEKGSVGTTYEAFRLISAKDSVNKNAIINRAVDGEKIDYSSIRPEHFEGAVFANMHNSEKLRKGISLSLSNGITEIVNAGIDLTEFIPCKPNKMYSAETFSRLFFYDKDKNFISLVSASPFTTPENCYFMRATITSSISDRFQMNEGAVLTSPVQPYTFTIAHLSSGGGSGGGTSPIATSDYLTRKYTFADAWIAWKSNKKFPICFVGDSTMEGYGTSNFTPRSLGGFGIDRPHTNNPNAYQSLFQDMIRAATGNTVMRTYNASYGGQGSSYAALNINDMLSGDYSDTKMVALGHGINDYFSANFPFQATYYEDHLETAIKAVFAKGMQPFIVTTQPITMPVTAGGGDRNLRNVELCREVALKLAHKYNLEVIDVNTHAEHFMRYSTKPLYNNIMQDEHNTIHFGDGGHKFTADLFYATFNPQVIWTTEGEQLDYMTQRVRSEILAEELTQMPTAVDGFKNQVVLTQDTAVDKLYQHFEVFNIGRKQLALTAHYANAAVGQYAEVNSVPTTITTQGQALGSLDLGLHIIKAKSSATTALDWRGFKLNPVV